MNTFYDLKKYGNPNGKEWKRFIITILVLMFIIGFNDRSGKTIGPDYFLNMILVLIILVFSIIISNLVSRYHTSWTGYKSEYSFSINGLLIGLMLAFVSNGYFWYLAPGYHIINMNETGRLGHFRYGLRMKDWARTAASGSMTYFLLALIAFISAQGNPFIDLFVKINIALGFYSLLPFPENNGLNIFFGERTLYFFCLFTSIGIWLSMKFITNFFGIILMGILIGCIILYLWFSGVEGRTVNEKSAPTLFGEKK